MSEVCFTQARAEAGAGLMTKPDWSQALDPLNLNSTVASHFRHSIDVLGPKGIGRIINPPILVAFLDSPRSSMMSSGPGNARSSAATACSTNAKA